MKIAVISGWQQAVAMAAMLSLRNEIRILDGAGTEEGILGQAEQYGVKNFESLFTGDAKNALDDAELVFISIAVPYDVELNFYDTHDVDMYLNQVMRYAPKALVVLRSDVPVGYTNRMKSRYPELNLVFVPDFGRNGREFQAAFYPLRIIIGGGDEIARETLRDLLASNACEVVYTEPEEAESVKLFANAYLAMRVAYFNELDTYAELRGLNSKDLIRSVSLDPRIGDLYNNPGFGYGGRYLVEGVCRLKSDFADIPERIVDIVETSNEVRKDHIVEMILQRQLEPQVCGVYGLGMKSGSKDFRYSAVDGVIRRLQEKGKQVILFEPMLQMERFLSADVIADFEEFAERSDVISANRMDDRIREFQDKIYTRDIFERD
ncbi:nucleotide sugar dehydrogenase [Clostridiales Family XIII bacterium BX16]|uniref:UDP-glucose 6-dehydrogenase n=1 Tax=Lentihominibacter faecis TaxID=2764712 RepID=A0A923NEX2_9FIRM|nr:nucleotide sugar dehydrogenase [Lentihominibacter faecis]MBC6000089.1 nucleotide sugar dehydrogenase [Lentihominibacter faecis]